jgi:hypothetical protein
MQKQRTASHILCDCEVVAELRFRHSGLQFMKRSNCSDVPLSKVLIEFLNLKADCVCVAQALIQVHIQAYLCVCVCVCVCVRVCVRVRALTRVHAVRVCEMTELNVCVKM